MFYKKSRTKDEQAFVMYMFVNVFVRDFLNKYDYRIDIEIIGKFELLGFSFRLISLQIKRQIIKFNL